MSVDMLAYAMDHPGRSASIILMSDDHELMYTLLALRHRGLHVTAVGPADSRIHLEEIATRYVEWEGMRVAETVVIPKDNSSGTEYKEDTISIAPVSEETPPEELGDTSAAILAEQPQTEETEAIHFMRTDPMRPEVDEPLHAIPGTLNATQIQKSSSFAPMSFEALPAPSSSQPAVVEHMRPSPYATPLDFCLHPQEYMGDSTRPEVDLSTSPIASPILEPLETTPVHSSMSNPTSQNDCIPTPFIDFFPLVNMLLRQPSARTVRWKVYTEMNMQHPLADYRKAMSMKGYLALAEQMGIIILGESVKAKKPFSQWISLGSDWQTRLKQAHASTSNMHVVGDIAAPFISMQVAPLRPIPPLFEVLIQILREAPGNAMDRQSVGHRITQQDPGITLKTKTKNVTAYIKLACQEEIVEDNQTGDGLGIVRWLSLHPAWRFSLTSAYGLFLPPKTMYIAPPGIVPGQFEGLFEFLESQSDGRAPFASVAEHMRKNEYSILIVDAGSINKYLKAACIIGLVTLNNSVPANNPNQWISLSPGWHSAKVNLTPLVPGTAPLPADYPGDPLPHHLSTSPTQAILHPPENCTINTNDVAAERSSPNPTLYDPIPSTQLDTENGLFRTLIDELSKYPAARQEYGTIDEGLMTHSPMVYAQAGVTTFAEYVSLAAKAGLVTTGQYRQGSGTISWVFLHPRLRAQPVLERSSNATHPVFDLLITVLRALGSGRKEMSAVAVALQTRDPLVYTKASTASSKKYFKKAAQQGIIIRGGDNSFKWIELAMAWRLPAADSGSSDARYEQIPSRGTLAGAEMPLFQKLIELLQQQTDCRMPLSVARNILRKSDPGIFAKAGCRKMQAYMQLASRKGVIILFEEMVFNGKSKRYVQLTAAYQPSVTPPLSSPPIPIYTSAETPKFATPQAEYPDIAQPPSDNADPGVSFSRLVGILQDMHDNGVSRPYQSTVHAHLINGHSSIYEEAGVQGYAEYFGLAKDQGIVELGGVGLRQYVSLIL
ncbi:hypothetical protein HWV62_24578 [Athelia sp. TMB]|nr:hypothetical protein HWV62_24578 [Athelia sp. TMB]